MTKEVWMDVRSWDFRQQKPLTFLVNLYFLGSSVDLFSLPKDYHPETFFKNNLLAVVSRRSNLNKSKTHAAVFSCGASSHESVTDLPRTICSVSPPNGGCKTFYIH